MKLGRLFSLVLLALLCGVAPPSFAGGKLVINSYGGSWGQAIQLGLIDQFQRETGIEVTLLSTWDIAKSKAALQSGNPPPEDILDTELATAVSLDHDGLLAPIDYGRFDKDTLASVPDYAKNKIAVGWGVFGIGICYDKEVFPEGHEPKTWADFWDFKNFPGKRGMLDWPDETQPEFGLIADGVPVDKLYPVDLDRAFKKLDELKPYVPKFPTSPAVLGQMLVDKQVVMEACFTHRVQRLIDGGMSRIAINFNQARLQTEYFTVWKNAPNRDNAMKFLAFILKASPQAAWAQIGNTGPINPKAFDLIPADLAKKLPTSPVYKTFVKDDSWYSATAAGGKTNRETIEDRWNKWAAAQ